MFYLCLFSTESIAQQQRLVIGWCRTTDEDVASFLNEHPPLRLRVPSKRHVCHIYNPTPNSNHRRRIPGQSRQMQVHAREPNYRISEGNIKEVLAESDDTLAGLWRGVKRKQLGGEGFCAVTLHSAVPTRVFSWQLSCTYFLSCCVDSRRY